MEIPFSLSVALFVGLSALVYVSLIYPLVAIYRCGKNQDINGFWRATWILGIAITGPLVAIAYFLRHPVGRASRPAAIVWLLFLVALSAAGAVGVGRLLDEVQRKMARTALTLGNSFQPAVPVEDRQAMTKHLVELNAQMASLPWGAVTQRITLYVLYRDVTQMQAGGALSPEDVRFWEGLYHDRDEVSSAELQLRIMTRGLLEGVK